MKIRPVRGEFHAGGRMGGHDEANSRIFRNFANVPKNVHQGTAYIWGTKSSCNNVKNASHSVHQLTTCDDG